MGKPSICDPPIMSFSSAKMRQFFMKFGALSGTPKQIMCHNSKNARPISTKFQGLLNLYERHAVDTF